MTTLTGRAAAIRAVCRAESPPTTSSTAATRPITTPQKTRNSLGGSSSPSDRMVVSTRVPESDEVMNQLISRNTIMADSTQPKTPEPTIPSAVANSADGRSQARTISMMPTDGLVRGQDVVDTGEAITVPVGNATLGRIMDVNGAPIDERGDVFEETIDFVENQDRANEEKKKLKVMVKIFAGLAPAPTKYKNLLLSW